MKGLVHSGCASVPSGQGGKPDATVSEILARAADLIEPEGAWGQDEYAVDLDGRSVGPTSASAVCFCALGALRRAGGFDDDMNSAAQALGKVVGDLVCDWNDAPGRTQVEVVEALRQAAKATASEAGQ